MDGSTPGSERRQRRGHGNRATMRNIRYKGSVLVDTALSLEGPSDSRTRGGKESRRRSGGRSFPS